VSAAAGERGTVHARSEPTVPTVPAEPTDVVFLPVTDWKTCQGADCTARTLCHYSCLGECLVDANAFQVGGIAV
jgi:hypothetical protein